MTKCGTIAVVGRPNVGKSTLMNALIGEHLSITSAKPQTTRHQVLGVLTQAHANVQYVFVDTPGFQTQFSNALNRTMNKSVTRVMNDVDLVLWVVESGKLKAADRQVLALLPKNRPVFIVVNKVDQYQDRAEVLPFLQQMATVGHFKEMIPVSAKDHWNLDLLLSLAATHMPEQAYMFEEDTLTNRPERFLAAERIREKVFRLVGDELPYTCTVVIDQFVQEGSLRRIFASILVDRDTHKAMIIGKAGAKLKQISSQARLDMERLFGGKVYLETFVKVRSGWADDAGLLSSLGYD